MTHTIYRGRQRIVPDPALSVLMDEQRERYTGMKYLHRNTSGENIQDSSLTISRTGDQNSTGDFEELLNHQQNRLAVPTRNNSADSKRPLETDYLPQQMPLVITTPTGLAERMPVFGQKNTILSEEWSVSDYIFEMKPTTRVCPAQETKK
jgi:hypothetical protein